VLGFILNFFLLGAGFVGIFFVSINEESFRDLFGDSNMQIVGELIPKILVSLINASVPFLTMKITNIEKWDDPAFLLKTQIARLYLGKILNVILYAALNIELAANKTFFGGDESRIPFDDSFNCREDQAGMNLILLVLSEALVSKIVYLSIPVMDYIVARCRRKPMQKREIETSKQIISLVYFQGLIWITFPFFPFVAVLSPLFLLTDFKF
jgi:hypothetical protein